VVDSAVVRVGHLEIAYRVAGGPEARPLVLLHALGEDSGDWGEVIDALAPTRRVYAPDLRGHGRSSWPGLYSLELMRADVLSFLDALELPVVDMVGHSLGGVVAYLLTEEQPAAWSGWCWRSPPRHYRRHRRDRSPLERTGR